MLTHEPACTSWRTRLWNERCGLSTRRTATLPKCLRVSYELYCSFSSPRTHIQPSTARILITRWLVRLLPQFTFFTLFLRIQTRSSAVILRKKLDVNFFVVVVFVVLVLGVLKMKCPLLFNSLQHLLANETTFRRSEDKLYKRCLHES